MNDSNDQSELLRLVQLVSEKCNGSIQDDGLSKLRELLVGRPELRTVYWQMNAIHADLEWDLVGKENARQEIASQLSEKRSTLLEIVRGGKSHKLRVKFFTLAASLGAVLLGGWAIWSLAVNGKPPLVARADNSPSHVPAQLSPLTEKSRWSFGRPGEWNPQNFRYGETVWVDQGMVEMRLEGGTVGRLSAPVILQLLSQDRIRLLSGKIKIHAPSRTNGFTVETPSAEVVDLGTEFSVEADQSGTDLIVHGGKVNLRVPQIEAANKNPTVTSKQFTGGQAVRVDRNGTLSRIMNVTSSTEKMANETQATPRVITSVEDNIVRDDIWAFYEIVAGGMGEDAFVFVDRLHEWNGITDLGMPNYLVGGDYVKMFNDDKMTDDYKVKVKLSQPAALYVLLDTRVSPPKWLTDSFSDTGDQIGIDETHHHRPGPEDHSEVGAGKSVDLRHSIWKLTVPKGGTIELGSNGRTPTNTPWASCMYGIVAVPLKNVAR